MQKRGLGRGLTALLGGAESLTGGVLEAPVGAIARNPFQPRQVFDEAALEDLASSIRDHGVLQPLLVRQIADGSYQLVAGERRLRAATLAGLETVPVLIKEFDDGQTFEVALIENLQREDINSIETAQAYQLLREKYGYTQEEIARKVGKARATVANTMRLLALPATVQSSILTGDLSEAHGRALLQAAGDRQAALAEQVVLNRLTVHETEALARRSQSSVKPLTGRAAHRNPKTIPVDPHDAALIQDLSLALGTKVELTRKGVGGTLSISFYSHEQLEGLVQRLAGGS